MKIRLFGLTVFEIQRDPSVIAAASLSAASAGATEPPPSTPIRIQSSADLHRSASILPRTHRGTIDVEASLQFIGITDPATLWQQRFRPGTVGTVLKCILGARGRKPGQLMTEQVSPDIHTCPVEDLPLVPGTGKLDLAACLKRFEIHDPSVLWKRSFRPDSAGSRMKMLLRARGYPPHPANHNSLATKPQDGQMLESSVANEPTSDPPCRHINDSANQRNDQGKLDIRASLQALGISDPKTLWQKQIVPGSAEHALKREIARALARRAVIPGITRQDIGLSA